MKIKLTEIIWLNHNTLVAYPIVSTLYADMEDLAWETYICDCCCLILFSFMGDWEDTTRTFVLRSH